MLRVKPFQPPLIILNQSHAQTALGSEAGTLICEPSNRSTTAAITMAAFHLQNQNVVMAVMPSDHVIEDIEIFQSILRQAASNNGITILGVSPKAPSSRYGYIQTQRGAIKHFIEKPTKAQAKDLITTGNCYWNTGIFTCTPQYFLDQLKQHRADIFEAAKAAYATHTQNQNIINVDSQTYNAIPSIAVDYAIMENLRDARCIELKSHWNDIGTWPSLLRQLLKKMFL